MKGKRTDWARNKELPRQTSGNDTNIGNPENSGEENVPDKLIIPSNFPLKSESTTDVD